MRQKVGTHKAMDNEPRSDRRAVINKRLMAGREHMVSFENIKRLNYSDDLWPGPQRDRRPQKSVRGPPQHPDAGRLL